MDKQSRRIKPNNELLKCIPVNFHADWFGPRKGFRRLGDLLDELPAGLVAGQKDVCLVARHTPLQRHQVKHGQVTALGTQTHEQTMSDCVYKKVKLKMS